MKRTEKYRNNMFNRICKNKLPQAIFVTIFSFSGCSLKETEPKVYTASEYEEVQYNRGYIPKNEWYVITGTNSDDINIARAEIITTNDFRQIIIANFDCNLNSASIGFTFDWGARNFSPEKVQFVLGSNSVEVYPVRREMNYAKVNANNILPLFPVKSDEMIVNISGDGERVSNSYSLKMANKAVEKARAHCASSS